MGHRTVRYGTVCYTLLIQVPNLRGTYQVGVGTSLCYGLKVSRLLPPPDGLS